MQSSRSLAKAQDLSAVSLSVLCAMHCLVIPIVSAMLPASALWIGQDWIHQLLVLIALPISGYPVAVSVANKESQTFVVLAGAGLTMLLAAAFLPPLHDVETTLTVLGAALLAASHVHRFRRRHRHPRQP